MQYCMRQYGCSAVCLAVLVVVHAAKRGLGDAVHVPRAWRYGCCACGSTVSAFLALVRFTKLVVACSFTTSFPHLFSITICSMYCLRRRLEA